MQYQDIHNFYAWHWLYGLEFVIIVSHLSQISNDVHVSQMFQGEPLIRSFIHDDVQLIAKIVNIHPLYFEAFDLALSR